MTPTLPDGSLTDEEIAALVRFVHFEMDDDERAREPLRKCLSELTRLQQELSAAKAALAVFQSADFAPIEQARLSGFREGIEAAAKAADDLREKFYDREASLMSDGASEQDIDWPRAKRSGAREIAAAIRSLSPPVEATDESVSPPAIEMGS